MISSPCTVTRHAHTQYNRNNGKINISPKNKCTPISIIPFLNENTNKVPQNKANTKNKLLIEREKPTVKCSSSTIPFLLDNSLNHTPSNFLSTNGTTMIAIHVGITTVIIGFIFYAPPESQSEILVATKAAILASREPI